MFDLFKALPSAIEITDTYNVNPKSDVIHTCIAEKQKISSTIARGFRSAALAFTLEFVVISILDDSILFVDRCMDRKKEPKFVKRMFWNQLIDYGFEINVKKKLFNDSIELKFIIDGEEFKTLFHSHKSKDSDERMSEKTLSFLLGKI